MFAEEDLMRESSFVNVLVSITYLLQEGERGIEKAGDPLRRRDISQQQGLARQPCEEW